MNIVFAALPISPMLRVLAFLFTLLCASLPSFAASLTLQEVLAEERAWAGLTTKTATVGGVQWTYSEGGDASKPDMLLLHGLTGSRDNWNRVASYLTDNYHVIIPDLPLHGDTKVTDDYDPQPAVLVDSLGELSRHLGLKDVHLAGHSLGGSVATYYAAKYFYNVQSVLLVAPGGVFHNAKTQFLKDPKQIERLLVAKSGDFERVFDYAFYKSPFLPRALLKEQEQMMLDKLPQMRRMINRTVEIAGHYKPETFELVAKAVEAPTLVIWGDKDRIINPEIAPELAGYLKHEEPVVMLKNVGHMSIMEADQIVAQHYLAFLQKAQAWNNVFKSAAPKAQ